MSARRPTTPTTLSCLACLALAGSDTRPTHTGRVDLPLLRPALRWPEENPTIEAALAAAIAASSTRDERDLEPRAHSHAAERILALAHDAGGARAVEPCVAALIADCAPFLECLPLERLKDVRIDARELRLDFDVAPGERLRVGVPERELVALSEDDDGAGVPVRVRSEARELFLRDTLRLELDGGRIRGVFDGDLEVSVGPFDVDLELRTERGPARPARDPFGRPLLALDAAGHPRRENGRWIVQTYELWIVLEALGHRVEVGVPLEDGGASTPSQCGAVPARPPSARARCSAWNRP